VIGDFHGNTVLVTGGTRGIGLEIALDFAQRGAQCALTCKSGTADEHEVYRRCADKGAAKPLIIRADAADADDTGALMEELGRHWDRIDVFVSNVAAGPVVNELDDYSFGSLSKTIEYSAWPMFAYTKRIREAFGRYPRYVVAMSTTGLDSYRNGYDFIASSKMALETLCRYMSYRLYNEDIRINVVRSGAVRTTTEISNCVVALCSGLLDGMRGQVITVDRGATSHVSQAVPI
jgi:NAD(P)-dependent dehydrogenase (short-subunit alcohol dehydrogenase family)